VEAVFNETEGRRAASDPGFKDILHRLGLPERARKWSGRE